jgi:hypothetical protein
MDDASLDDFLGDDDAAESDDVKAEGQPTADEADAEPEAEDADTEPEADEGDAGGSVEADEADMGGDESEADGDGSEVGADETDARSEEEAEANEPDDGDDGVAVDPEAVEPAASTYAWSAEPVACAACGTAVRRRFRDAAGLVCADCKEW